MTVPNILTISRILLTPLLIWFLLDHRLNDALIVFFVAGMTDGLDGLIARLFNQKSRLGAYLDPVADKLLLVSSFVLLGRLGLVPVWLVVIAVSRDLIIVLGLAVLHFQQIPVEIRPVLLSKFTTLMQLFTVLISLASSLAPLPPWVYEGAFYVTGLLSIVSGFQYLLIGLSLLEAERFRNGGKTHFS